MAFDDESESLYLGAGEVDLFVDLLEVLVKRDDEEVLGGVEVCLAVWAALVDEEGFFETGETELGVHAEGHHRFVDEIAADQTFS